MRLPNAEHAAHPWVIAQVAPDFELIDAWALPAQGGRDGFDALLKVMAAVDGANAESALTRALFRVRYQLGAWFGWEDAGRQLPIPGCSETTLSQRLPADLRGSATGLDLGPAGFAPLYRTPTSGPPSCRTAPCTPCCTWPGSSKARTGTAGRWASTSSPGASSARRTWR